MLGILRADGAGKSTILALLQRHFDVTHGEIRLTICRCRFCSSTAGAPGWRWSIRRHFYSPIPSPIISRWKPDATQAQIERVAQLASVHDDILRLPQATRPKWASAA